jgi:hypothetical protein
MKTQVENCTAVGCWRVPIAWLEGHPLCRTHFIESCEAEVGDFQRRLKENRLGEALPEALTRFVDQCLQQADHIEQHSRDLSDVDRGRLLSLILRAAELRGRVRRSPRTPTAVAILVRSEEPGQPWEEETKTRLISRYGALVEFQHSLEIGENLCVRRLDNGRMADARVAWHVRRKRTPTQAGIEFRDCDNFWELDWNRIS